MPYFNETFAAKAGQFMRKLGRPVVYTPTGKDAVDIVGIFKSAQAAQSYNGMAFESPKPMLTVKTSDVKDPEYDIDIDRDSGTFKINVLGVDVTYDAISVDHSVITGMTKIELKRAA